MPTPTSDLIAVFADPVSPDLARALDLGGYSWKAIASVEEAAESEPADGWRAAIVDVGYRDDKLAEMMDGVHKNQLDVDKFRAQCAQDDVEPIYRFGDKERDTETGLHYFEARYCDTDAARFMAVDESICDDPARYFKTPQVLNLYAYAASNPLRYTDPTGNDPKPAVIWEAFKPESEPRRRARRAAEATTQSAPAPTGPATPAPPRDSDFLQREGGIY